MNNWFFVFALFALICAGTAYADTKVDIELVLAADISDSMSGQIGQMQRQGYAAALRSAEIAALLTSGAHRKVAISYIEWGDSGHVAVVVPWTLVEKPADARRIANILANRREGQLNRTSISHALQFANGLFESNGFEGERRVIDISGNGPNNQGASVADARDAVVRSGTTINGLPIMIDMELPRGPFWDGFDLRKLDAYFEECVIGGPGAFVLPVRRSEDFPNTLRAKLFLEVSGQSLPAAPRLRPAGVEC